MTRSGIYFSGGISGQEAAKAGREPQKQAGSEKAYACERGEIYMIKREDILSIEYLKKTEFSGCHQGMRYRLEGIAAEDGKKLRATVWPEPFNFFRTPEEEKKHADFTFDDDGVVDAVAWMNDRLFQEKNRWEHAGEKWDNYKL